MSFLNDYTPPIEKSDWFTIADGETHNVRIMGRENRPETYVLGWQGFKDNQPIYRQYNESGYKEVFEYLNADKNKDEKKVKPTHFWTVAIYHEDDKCAMVWNIRQKTIQQSLSLYMLDPEWGDPNNYILKVSRVGKSLSDTEYSVTPKSPNIAPPDNDIIGIMEEARIDCRVVYSGGQPMGALEIAEIAEIATDDMSNIERLKSMTSDEGDFDGTRDQQESIQRYSSGS